MAAWVTKEWREDGRRRREKCQPGTKGVKESDRFVVEFLDPDNKRRREKIDSTGKTGKRIADARCREITAELDAGTYQSKRKASWKDFREEYETKVLAGMLPQSASDYRIGLNHFERVARPGRVASIKAELLASYVAKRRTEYSHIPDPCPDHDGDNCPCCGGSGKIPRLVRPATINKELRSIRVAVHTAHEWEYIPKVPKFPFVKETKKLATYVLPEHFGKIYGRCDAARFPRSVPGVSAGAWWRALLTFLFMTGWRIAQTLALEWSDVDLTEGTAITRGDDNKGKRDSKIALHPVVVEHLRKIRPTDLGVYPVFPWDVTRRRLWEEFQHIQAMAEVLPPDWMRIEHYGFHDLRRGFATLNADKLTPDALQALMQHQDYQTTQRYINMAKQLRPSVEGLYVPELPVEAAKNSFDD